MKRLIKGVIILLLLSQVNGISQDYLTGVKLYQDVKKYTSFGEHRVGGKANQKTIAWLKKHFKKLDYQVSDYPFEVEQFFFQKGKLRLPQSTIDIFPLYPVCRSIVGTTSGKLVDAQTTDQYQDKIVLTSFPYKRGGSLTEKELNILKPIIDGQARAIVIVTESISGEVKAFNVHESEEKMPNWQIPIICVGSKYLSILQEVAATEADISFTVKGSFDDQTSAQNIIAEKKQGEEYIVISTPLSGWFSCGGERGPGIAIFKGLATWLATFNTKYSLLFLGNSGHELGYAGIKYYIQDLAPPPEKVKLWLHLGAGLASYDWDTTTTKQLTTIDPKRYLMYSQNLDIPVKEHFDESNKVFVPVKDIALGELKVVWEEGYPTFIGMAAGNWLFHAKDDLAESTGADILEVTAKEFQQFLSDFIEKSEKDK